MPLKLLQLPLGLAAAQPSAGQAPPARAPRRTCTPLFAASHPTHPTTSPPTLCAVNDMPILDPNTPRSPKHQAAEQLMTTGKTAQVGGLAGR